MAKKLHPNISASYYDGETQVCFDCIGEQHCKFAVGYIMPLPEDEPCIYKTGGGDCHCQAAHLPALKKLVKEINDQIKGMEDASHE